MCVYIYIYREREIERERDEPFWFTTYMRNLLDWLEIP